VISRSLVFGSNSSPTTSGMTAMMIEYQGLSKMLRVCEHRLHLSVVTAEWTSRQHILLKRFPTAFIEASEELLDFVFQENDL
jgi:putative IMPACT (imprinted ancient) family translation regulator